MNNDILPFFQGGGLVLPQYRPTGATLQTPQTANLLINTYNQNSQQDFGRYMQLEQLGMQRQQQAEQINNSRMDQQFKMSQQIRVNKQIDLQNKKFEYEQLQAGVTAQSKALEWGTDEFLPADQAKLDELFKPINEQLNTADPHDLENIYKIERQKKMIAMHYENGYANKKEYTNAAKVLTDDPNQTLRSEYAKAGYIDQDADAIYVQNKIDYFKNLEQFKATGDRTYLDNVKALASKIATIQDLIDEDAQNKINEANRLEQQADINNKIATAELKNQQASNARELGPVNLKLQEAKAQHEGAKTKSEIEAYNRLDQWRKANPNATNIEYGRAEQEILGNSKSNNDVPGSLDAATAREVYNGNLTLEEAYNLKNTKTSTVNYNTPVKDNNGIDYVASADGKERMYSGWVTDDTGAFKRGSYGGSELTVKQLTDAGAGINTDGSIDIKQSKLLSLIPGIGTTFINSDAIKKFFGANAEMIENAWGTDDNVWKIKPTGTLPQSTNSSGGYFNSTTTSPPATSGKQW